LEEESWEGERGDFLLLPIRQEGSRQANFRLPEQGIV